MDSIPIAPLLIATAPTRRADRYAAIATVVVSLIVLAFAAPYADAPWPLMVAFIPSTDTGLIVIDVITATLLLGQFVQLRRPSLLVLSCGYFFATFIVIAHLLSAAEFIRSVRPHSANAATTTWILILWLSLFPVFVMLYAMLSQSDRDRPVAGPHLVKAVGLCVLTALGLTGICIAIAILAPHPGFAQQEGDFALLTAAGTWVISAIALVLLYLRTRARRILDLWLCVVLFAWLLDILIGGLLSHTPYNFGWYAGRVYGLLAASVVLFALLLETGALYGQLTRAFAGLQASSAALSQSEASLRQAQKMEAIGQLTGGVAHDFNNLLTVIIGSLDMLGQQHGDSQRAVRLTEYAMQAAVRGEQLTKQLLAFSRRQMVDPQVRDPNRLIRDFEGLLRRAVGEAVQIILDLADGVGAIHVDPAQFESAILNLAVNARDAMDGKGVITIRTRGVAAGEMAVKGIEAAAGGYVMVALSDTGAGMDAATVSRAFEPFFTTKPSGKGSGLGLSQVYGFVTSSQGFVEIDSTPGQGTTIRLYLPAASGDLVSATIPESTESTPLAREGETVLIVEDDPGVLTMAVESLTELGYGVLTAASGPEALQQIRSDARIDVLFSDVVMPGGMNGVEVAFEARRIRPAQNILLTSGYAAGVLSNGGALPEGVGMIGKPYRLDELAQKLRQAIDGGRRDAR